MGVEGAPEGPEDPIAQICVTLGTVRRLSVFKNTRAQILHDNTHTLFFPFIVLEVFFFLLRRRRSKSTQPPPGGGV